MSLRHTLNLLTALLCLVAMGCGDDGGYTAPEGVVVTGKVLHGGEPMQVERADIGLGFVELVLIPEGADPDTNPDGVESTFAESDGTFIFEGPGEGVPSGKYRLAVHHYEQGPESDRLEGAFSASNTPITIDISADNIGSDQDVGVIELTELAGSPDSADE